MFNQFNNFELGKQSQSAIEGGKGKPAFVSGNRPEFAGNGQPEFGVKGGLGMATLPALPELPEMPVEEMEEVMEILPA